MQASQRFPFSSTSSSIFCFYTNQTNQIQILRVNCHQDAYFERVAFPGQRLIFEAEPTAFLEIHTGTVASSILSDKIPCSKIQVQIE